VGSENGVQVRRYTNAHEQSVILRRPLDKSSLAETGKLAGFGMAQRRFATAIIHKGAKYRKANPPFRDSTLSG
jgi:hypothetical protein